MITSKLSFKALKSLLSKASDMQLSNVWIGYGNTLILDLGEIQFPARLNGKPKGEIEFILECNWRILDFDRIVSGNGFNDNDISSCLENITNKEVSVISFSNTSTLSVSNRWIEAF